MELESDQYSRIIFISIIDLQKIKFDKLEQVCDKVYVFVDKDEKSIPFYLVKQLQHLGENVRWVGVDGKTPEAVASHISFYLGRLDEQIQKDIEFAIISEDTKLDNLIQYINEEGRSCIRVTRSKQKTTSTGDLNGISWSTKKEELPKEQVKGTTNEPPRVKTPEREAIKKAVHKEIMPSANTATAVATKPNNGSGDQKKVLLSDKIAKETIKRLVLSGNRPAALESLKSYILLQYNTVEVNQQINVIIQKMEQNKEIAVKEGAVVYNF